MSTHKGVVLGGARCKRAANQVVGRVEMDRAIPRILHEPIIANERDARRTAAQAKFAEPSEVHVVKLACAVNLAVIDWN